MTYPVFISYARGSTQTEAKALHHALGGQDGLAFLDTTDIQPGATFPRELVEAVLGARCIVVFADATYFQRRFCLMEWELALARYTMLQGNTVSEQDTQRALAGIIVARPSAGLQAPELDRLPPRFRQINMPVSYDTALLAELVQTTLRESPTTIRERFPSPAIAAALVDSLLETSAQPLPQSLRGLPLVPLQLGLSLRDVFVGRGDDLWRIHDAFFGSGRDTFPIVSLIGGGGVGKTRLALEYVHRFGPTNFPGGLFWIDASADETLREEWLYQVLHTLQPSTPALHALRASGLNVVNELAQALHHTSSERPILFVVNNLPEPTAGAHQDLRRWCPGLGKVALLTTSRAAYLGPEQVQPVYVQPLSQRAAVRLLTAHLPADSTTEDWGSIAKWVGHVPLFLELLNRAVQAGQLSPTALRHLAAAQNPASELDRLADRPRHCQRGWPSRGNRGL